MATIESESITPVELQLAARNHGLPLEALRFDVTPPGLHYLLIHYDIPPVEPRSWRLRIDGLVATELELSLEELRALPAVTRAVTMECAGNGRARFSPRPVSQPWLLEAVGNAEWTGTPLVGVLRQAGIAEEAVELVFTGLDRGVEAGQEQAYARSLTVPQAMADDVLLVYGMHGAPLPPQHGAPLRLLVPGWYGMTSVKWLTTITAVDRPFAGHQQADAYRLKQDADDEGVPVTRMRTRSLMVAPGVPGFPERRRFLDAGTHRVEGRAWSGRAGIARVEMSVDGGRTWSDADLGPQPDPRSWRGWSWSWDARPGEHELACRATDQDGETQPLADEWNLGGYEGTAVQRVAVTVR